MFGRLTQYALYFDPCLFRQITELTANLAEQTQHVQNLADAVTEIDSVFDENSCLVRVGEVYIEMSNDDAKTEAEKELEQETVELKKMERELVELKAESEELKIRLKTKFGDAINLEMEPEKK